MKSWDGQPLAYASTAVLSLLTSPGDSLAGTVEFAGRPSLHFDWGDAPPPLMGGPVIAARADALVYGDGQTPVLTVLNGDFEKVAEIRWPAFSEPITPEEIKEVRDRIWSNLGEIRPEMARQLQDWSVRPEFLPDSRPAFGSIMIDSDGRIWVSRFEPYDIEDRWYVLDASGTPLARLKLPTGSRLTDVRNGQVLLVTTDSLDVPSVVSYSLPPFPAGSPGRGGGR